MRFKPIRYHKLSNQDIENHILVINDFPWEFQFIFIPPATEGEGGVYWFEPVRPSGRPVVDTCYRNNS